jgi:hypothetical protein
MLTFDIRWKIIEQQVQDSNMHIEYWATLESNVYTHLQMLGDEGIELY